MRPFLITVITSFLCFSACTNQNDQPTSPDGRLKVLLSVNAENQFTWSILKEGDIMVAPSGFKFEFMNQEDFGNSIQLKLLETTEIDTTWEPLWGKSSRVNDQYRQYLYRMEEIGGSGRYLEWILRVYNDGVAFRYNFPEDSGFGDFKLTDEETSFNLDPSNKAWATNHGQYYSSQEHTYDERVISDIGPEEVIGCPLLVEVGDRGWILITEADLTNWAGMYFKAADGASGTMVTSLASLKRDPAIKVEAGSPVSSPWRVVMVGDDPGTLIESNIITNLNDPSEYDDVSWIEPGLSAWDRWWSGDYGPDAGFKLGMNTATMKYFIDLAHDMEWKYMIVDWSWYGEAFIQQDGVQLPNPDADITTPIEEVDIEGLIKYAGERKVRIILWVLSMHLDRQMDEALAQYEKWGAAGIKVDFMDCDDQDMVNWYHTVARKAASHHLVVDFHGAYKPTGVSRTLPNMLTREGVLGNEYNKWSDLITPRHTVVLPYTRGVLGEMDFTPGGFHHSHQDDFIIVGGDAPNPYVMGTRCHQLAMLVVYESAFGVMCDSPYNYRDQPGTDFLRLVPTTWDETRYLSGYPGESIMMARRSGDQWFVGGMTNEQSREVTFTLDFLGGGIHSATIWKDAEDAGTDPANLQLETISELTRDSSISLKMEQGGGFVMILD
jgi:alpha-glucosidase